MQTLLYACRVVKVSAISLYARPRGFLRADELSSLVEAPTVVVLATRLGRPPVVLVSGVAACAVEATAAVAVPVEKVNK